MLQGLSRLDYSTQFSVQHSFAMLTNVSRRLSSLLRINQGSDDPAGMIAADHLSRELSALDSAVRSADRTLAFTRVTDGALAHVGEMLHTVESKFVAAANSTLSQEERDALQLEVDASLDAINRLGQTTFAGRPVFSQSATFLAGPDPSQVESLDLPAVDDSLGGDQGTLADLRSGGTARVSGGDPAAGQSIVADAQSQITALRARIGAFDRTVVNSTRRVLSDAVVQVSGARSAIRDADLAAEVSLFARDFVLAETSLFTSRALLQLRHAAATLLTRMFDQAV